MRKPPQQYSSIVVADTSMCCILRTEMTPRLCLRDAAAARFLRFARFSAIERQSD